jgi:hypothetical protein
MGMVTQAQPAPTPNGTGHWWPSKYGPEDQTGALNEITPGKVLEAVQLARRGQVYERLGTTAGEHLRHAVAGVTSHA